MVGFSRNWENLTAIELNNNNNGKITYTAFQEDLKYSDFFRDQASQRIGDVRREFIFYGLEMGLEKAAVLIQVT